MATMSSSPLRRRTIEDMTLRNLSPRRSNPMSTRLRTLADILADHLTSSALSRCARTNCT
jgi:hypothetical protein